PTRRSSDLGDEQTGQVAELLVDQRAVDARGVGDAVDGGGVEALAADDRVRDVEQLFECAASGSCSPTSTATWISTASPIAWPPNPASNPRCPAARPSGTATSPKIGRAHV